MSIKQSVETSQTTASIDPVLNLLDHVRDDMAKVDALILSETQARAELIPTVSEYLISSGGKRLRPLLTLASARACGYEGVNHITMAASIEFMHTATLLHDDVVDNSALRRGRKTARLLWGNPASVLVGDYLLGRAFKMMVTSGSLEALSCLADAAAIIAEGEVMQLTLAYTLNNQIHDYEQIISAKTAALFVAATKVGAILADRCDTIKQAMADFGHYLGVAFQLSDDILDYSPDNPLGKTSGDDFLEGKITLPVIIAYQNSDSAQRHFWQTVFKDDVNRADFFDEAVDIIAKTGALSACQARAVSAADAAISALDKLPETHFHDALCGVAQFAASRCLAD